MRKCFIKLQLLIVLVHEYILFVRFLQGSRLILQQTINMRVELFLILFFIYSAGCYSQGCSDAGVCSIHPGVQAEDSEVDVAYIFASQTMELGEQQVLYFHSTVGFTLPLSPRFNTTVSLPFRNAYFKQSWYSSLSDVLVLLSADLNENIILSAGSKIPVGDANNKDEEGDVLPMALQPGLGTYDAIVLLRYQKNKWNVGFGYQYVFGQNENTFIANEKYPEFETSYNLNRGDDLMLRYDRIFDTPKNKWQASLISSYRLGGDKIYGNKKVKDSEGLSLNLAISLLKPQEHHQLEYMLAVPLLVREARVDGLTRSAILSIRWSGAFNR
ncbi:hypothetical protein E9993_06595 [Labilibacter sediminis]|nr:hypothetical protein E9993_06595 [Labilibacter sediminis]